MKNLTLNSRQQRLVEENLSVVRHAIHKNIIVNDSLYGFEYDDLYQEGCIWLCKAAISFDETRNIKFATYAEKVVTNGLRTYCRLMCASKSIIFHFRSKVSRMRTGFPWSSCRVRTTRWTSCLRSRTSVCCCKTASGSIPVLPASVLKRSNGRSRACPVQRSPKCMGSSRILWVRGSPELPDG